MFEIIVECKITTTKFWAFYVFSKSWKGAVGQPQSIFQTLDPADLNCMLIRRDHVLISRSICPARCAVVCTFAFKHSTYSLHNFLNSFFQSIKCEWVKLQQSDGCSDTLP